MNILLVEDDANLGSLLKCQFEGNQISVHVCSCGKDALKEIYAGTPADVMVLDWMLPDISGIDLLHQLYFDKISIPTIMLTALDALQNKTEALSLGADDYVTKPFEFDELLARVLALHRRATHTQTFDYTYGDVIYHIGSRIIQCADRQTKLTGHEAAIFELLLKNPDTIVSQDEIITAIWGPRAQVGSGNISNYIYFVRNRLKSVGSSVRIENVYGGGYRLCTHD